MLIQGAQSGALEQLRGVVQGGCGRQVQEGRDIHILMANSCCCMAETNATL